MNVSKLFVHPVKSLAGISVNRFAIDRFGPAGDRRWMVVNEKGHFLTQRQYAGMALIKTALNESGLQGNHLTLLAADGNQIQLSPGHVGDVITVTVWGDQCEALVAPEAVNLWMSEQLGVKCRLVFMPEQNRRQVDTDFAEQGETVGFADGFPLLLTTEASLQDFNDKLSLISTLTVDMDRFRPNVVVSGNEPWAEDQWRRIRIGEAIFRVAKPCSRCAIPTIDPTTGHKQADVFRALKQHRQRDGKVYFGQNLLVEKAAPLQTGDEVEVLD